MAAGGAQTHSHVLVVGDRGSSFVKETARVAREYDLAVVACDDVYSAAIELARGGGRFLLVAGTFDELATGREDFLALVRRHGVSCCCLLDRGRRVKREKILAAVRVGACLAGEMDDLRRVLEDRLAAARRPRPNGDHGDPLSDADRATEAEIEALLGQEIDE